MPGRPVEGLVSNEEALLSSRVENALSSSIFEKRLRLPLSGPDVQSAMDDWEPCHNLPGLAHSDKLAVPKLTLVDDTTSSSCDSSIPSMVHLGSK